MRYLIEGFIEVHYYCVPLKDHAAEMCHPRIMLYCNCLGIGHRGMHRSSSHFNSLESHGSCAIEGKAQILAAVFHMRSQSGIHVCL